MNKALIILIFSTFSIGCTTLQENESESRTVTLHASIDGHITFTVNEGANLDGGVSLAQKSFDELRRNNNMSMIYVGHTNEYSDNNVVAKIHSDILSLQYQQELTKLSIAEYSLSNLEDLYKEEKAIDDYDHGMQELQSQYRTIQVEGEADRYLKAGILHVPVREELRVKGKEVESRKVSSDRVKRSVKNKLIRPNKLKIAMDSLSSAQKSVGIIEASLALGSITCPTRCTIKDLHVVNGQYVTKGDAIADVKLYW